jgi:uncharacterized protein involved in exopolysaccharide biosynthesis
MPLRETEAGAPALPSRDNNLAAHTERRPAWPELVDRLWSQRRTIAKWVLLGLLVSVLVALLGGKYQATVQLMPPDTSSGGLGGLLPLLSRGSGTGSGMSPGLVGLAGDVLGVKSNTALFAKVVQSRTVEDNIIQQFDLRRVYGRKYFEDARKQLALSTVVEEDKRSGVLSITVIDKDPIRARDMANAYVVQLNIVLTNASTSSARREREFIEQRLVQEKSSLEEADQQLSKFASGNMALDVPEQTRITVESAARLQGELIAARAELEGLEQIYTPENVRVKSAAARVGELERQLKKINTATAASPGGQDPAFPYPSVKALPTLGVQWTNLYREAKIDETVVEMLTAQLESARIQEAKEVPVAKVLDAAVLPEKKYPRPFWVMVIGGLSSFVLACAGALLKDRWEAWDETDPRRILLSNIYFGTRNGLNSIWSVFRGGRANRDPQ